MVLVGEGEVIARLDAQALHESAGTGTVAVGAGHLHFTERKDAAPDAEAVRKMVATVLAGATR